LAGRGARREPRAAGPRRGDHPQRRARPRGDVPRGGGRDRAGLGRAVGAGAEPRARARAHRPVPRPGMDLAPLAGAWNVRPMPTARAGERAFAVALALVGTASVAGCARRPACAGEYCGTLVIAAASDFSITRDVTEQLFLKLAELGPGGTTVGDQDFAPQLAARWEWDGPTTLAFHLDPRARWQDGRPVTAADVV